MNRLVAAAITEPNHSAGAQWNRRNRIKGDSQYTCELFARFDGHYRKVRFVVRKQSGGWSWSAYAYLPGASGVDIDLGVIYLRRRGAYAGAEHAAKQGFRWTAGEWEPAP